LLFVRCEGREIGEVPTVHREDQVEAVEVLDRDLPRALGREVVTARRGGLDGRAVGRVADMPVPGAGAVDVSGWQVRAQHGFGRGGPADVAEADAEDRLDHAP
jgi:hypothetical protein